jgi:4-hydroxy-tetrahydrodipicolinate synthase
MRIKHPLTGAMVALITPMFEDGSVDFDTKYLVGFLISKLKF